MTPSRPACRIAITVAAALLFACARQQCPSGLDGGWSPEADVTVLDQDTGSPIAHPSFSTEGSHYGVSWTCSDPAATVCPAWHITSGLQRVVVGAEGYQEQTIEISVPGFRTLDVPPCGLVEKIFKQVTVRLSRSSPDM